MKHAVARVVTPAVLIGAWLCTSGTDARGFDPARAAARNVTGVARVDGRPRKDVVVWLEGPAAASEAAPPMVVLDQRNLEFSPRVMAVRVGTRVRMPNNDRVFHNVFSFKDGKRFDLGLYPVGTSKVVQFDRPGLSRVFCNIHPNMAAYVMAVDSSHFAVTDDDGRFTMADVPDGPLTYHAWRAGAQIRTGSVATDARPLEIAWP